MTSKRKIIILSVIFFVLLAAVILFFVALFFAMSGKYIPNVVERKIIEIRDNNYDLFCSIKTDYGDDLIDILETLSPEVNHWYTIHKGNNKEYVFYEFASSVDSHREDGALENLSLLSEKQRKIVWDIIQSTEGDILVSSEGVFLSLPSVEITSGFFGKGSIHSGLRYYPAAHLDTGYKDRSYREVFDDCWYILIDFYPYS